MDLIQNFSSGLFIIQSIIFIGLLFMLKKFAWTPILNSIEEREVSIIDSLNQAKLAKKEMENVKEENAKIIKEAKLERDNILKDARETKDKIVADAQGIAKVEADKIISQAKAVIENEKTMAQAEIKNHIGSLSLTIAEKLVKQKLNNDETHNALVSELLNNHNN